MKEEIRRWTNFARDVVADERISKKNKVVAGAMIAWLLSPIDPIPDFIPLVGAVDDLVIVYLLLDYLFNEIPMEVLIDHYPGTPVSLLRMRRRTRVMRRLIPQWVIDRLWR